jgi:hypothetical protein
MQASISPLWLMDANNTPRRPTAQSIAYTEPKGRRWARVLDETG